MSSILEMRMKQRQGHWCIYLLPYHQIHDQWQRSKKAKTTSLASALVRHLHDVPRRRKRGWAWVLIHRKAASHSPKPKSMKSLDVNVSSLVAWSSIACVFSRDRTALILVDAPIAWTRPRTMGQVGFDRRPFKRYSKGGQMLSRSGNRKYSSRHASVRRTSAFNFIALALRMDLNAGTSASALTAKIATT